MSAKATDRLLTLAELATYLHMGRKTVLKLVDSKQIPGVQLNNEWRFRRGDIDQWLSEQLDAEVDDFEEIRDGMQVPLADLMPQEAIVHDMRAIDSLGAIEELAAHAYAEKWLNDKPWFIGALVERETLASTAMEGGVAFLHTRARDTRKIRRPFVICGRSYEGIDFGAPDGKPTFLFFLLGLKYDKLHLPILGRLARITMRNPTIVARLRATTSPIKMRATLLKLDSEELSATNMPMVAERPQAPQFDPKARLRQIMRLNARRVYDAKKAQEESAKAEKKARQKAAREAARREKAAAAKAGRASVAGKATKAGKSSSGKTAKATGVTSKSSSKRTATAKSAAKSTSAASKVTAKKSAAKKTAGTSGASKKSTSTQTAKKKSTSAAKKPAAKKSTSAKKSASGAKRK